MPRYWCKYQKTQAGWLAVVFASALSCSQGGEIPDPEANSRTSKRPATASDAQNHRVIGENEPKAGTEPILDDEMDQGKAAVAYPRLEFRGSGRISCRKRSPTLVDELSTQLSQTRLDVTLNKAVISDAGKGEDEANEEIQKSIGTTTYTRPTAAEKSELKGFDFAPYAIFATKLAKQTQHETYTLSRPLPVFPWPANRARYNKLKEIGSKTWTAKVSGGGRRFTSRVTVSYVSETDDEITLKFHNEIPEDNENSATFRSLYEVFPIAREAVYTINYQTKDVRRIHVTSWFFGDRCKKSPSSVDLIYKLCRKVSDTKDETHNCI